MIINYFKDWDRQIEHKAWLDYCNLLEIPLIKK